VNRPISFMDFNDIGSPVDSNAPTVEEAKEEQEADLITSGLPDELNPTKSDEPKSETGNININEPEPETQLHYNTDRDYDSYERHTLREEHKVDLNVAFREDTSENNNENIDDTISSPHDGYVNSYAICTSALPLSFDSEGVLKRKVTRGDEDNRTVTILDIGRKKENMILPNVIFFPDKSKGASPKRYGPKRLGKKKEHFMSPEVMDITSEVDSLSDGSVDIERPGECSSHAGDVVTNNGQSRCEDNAPLSASESCAESDDVKDELEFTEDHFGFYTGSVATGISEHFKITDEEKQCRESATNVSATFLEPQTPNEYANIIHSVFPHHMKREENTHSRTFDTTEKTQMKMCTSLKINKKKPKSYEHVSTNNEEISVERQDMDSEIIEICENCRESRDICGCLLFGKVHIFQCTEMLRKPHLASFRYRQMFGKEIPWDIIVSKQGTFAKYLASVKTPIAHDNRLTYRFQLPIDKGLKLIGFEESIDTICTDSIARIQMPSELDKYYANEMNDNDLNSSDDCDESLEADRKFEKLSDVVDSNSTSLHSETSLIEGQFELNVKEVDVSYKCDFLENLIAKSKTSDFAKLNGCVLDAKEFCSVGSKKMKCIPLRIEDDDRRAVCSASFHIRKEQIQNENELRHQTSQPLTNGADLACGHTFSVNEKNKIDLLNTSVSQSSNANSTALSKITVENDLGLGNGHEMESKERQIQEKGEFRKIQIPCFSDGNVVFGEFGKGETSKRENFKSGTSFLTGALNGAGNIQLDVDSGRNKCSDEVIGEQHFGNCISEVQIQNTHDTYNKAMEDKIDLTCEKVLDSNRESGSDDDLQIDPKPSHFGHDSTSSLQVHARNLVSDTNPDAIYLKRTTPASEDDNRLKVMKELGNRAKEQVQKTNTIVSTNSESRTSAHQGSNPVTGVTLGDSLQGIHGHTERLLRGLGLPGIDLPFLRVPNNRLHNAESQDVVRDGERISDFVRSFYEIGDHDMPSDSDSSINSSRSSSPVNAELPGENSRNNVLNAMLSRETAGKDTDSHEAVGGKLPQSEIKSFVETPVSNTDAKEIDICETQPPTPECKENDVLWQKFMQLQLQKCLQITDLPRSFRATVLCVDASHHMAGEPWRQALDSLHRYLDCIASVKHKHQIEEYVALVVVGQAMEVKVHLTTDYCCVEKAIDTIELGGPCLLLPALALSMYCLTSFKYRNTESAHGVTLDNRIIVISSGKIDFHEWYVPNPLGEPNVSSDNRDNSPEEITEPHDDRIEINLQKCDSDTNSLINTDVLLESSKTLCDHVHVILADSSKAELQNNSDAGCNLSSSRKQIAENKSEAVSLLEKGTEYGSVVKESTMQGPQGHGFVILPVRDRQTSEDELPSLISNTASSISGWSWEDCDTELHFVPIGQGPNKLCFDAIKSNFNTEKIIVQIQDEGIDQLARSTHNLHIVGQVTNQMFAAKKEFDPTLFAAIVKHLYPDRTDSDVAEMLKVGERSFLEWVAKNAEEKEPWFSWRFEKSNLPEVGARVIVGPDLEEESKMILSEKGTCVKHTIAEEKVLVFWDNGCSSFHKIGSNEKCEVLPEDTPRDCWPGLQIKLGYSVKRGPHWDYGNQDGGKDKVGRVSYVFKDNTVIVRWPNGTNQLYRYKANGIQDVVISDPDDPYGTKEHTEKMNVRNTLDPNEKRWTFPITIDHDIGGSCEMNK
ncbi:hypothetical protein DPMN_117029, partial [Dreissena polymorpha]